MNDIDKVVYNYKTYKMLIISLGSALYASAYSRRFCFYKS